MRDTILKVLSVKICENVRIFLNDTLKSFDKFEIKQQKCMR